MKSSCVSHLLFNEIMFVPGAEISGFILPSRVGPLLLDYEIISSTLVTVYLSYTFPTDIML